MNLSILYKVAQFSQFNIEEQTHYRTSLIPSICLSSQLMLSPIPQAEAVPLVAPQEDITPGSVSEQTTNLICRQLHQAEVTIHVDKVQKKDKNEQNGQNEVKMAEMQPLQSHDSKTEETALYTAARKDQTPASKHVNFSQPLPSPLPPTQFSFTCQPNPCHQTQHFQVHIHQVQSRQSLSQNGEQRYQIIFTKSQINIPLQYQGSKDDEQKEKKQRLAQSESASCSIRPSTEDDFYVHFLQEKWAKREHEQQQQQLIKHLQLDYQQSQTAPNSMQKSTSNNLILTAPKSNQSQTHKILSSLTKKNKFKVKKIHDKHTLSIINFKNHLSTSQILPTNPSSNKSELIDSKNNYLKPDNYNRAGKKNISNFDGSPNKYLTKPSIYKKQIDPNVQYKISEGKGINMMSRILEDRCYNNGVDKRGSQNVEGQADAANKIRKIIKRSPYGILEIEVKDKKNNAKITNLRILKPKDMIRLKKMPNLIKGNKENTASGPATQQANIQSQKEIGQGGLPLLNCNKK